MRLSTFGFMTWMALVAGSSTLEAAPVIRLSWNACEPRQDYESFHGPGSYPLTISLSNSSDRFFGWDIAIEVIPGLPFPDYCGFPDPIPHQCDYPDAWRFEEGGCQGPSRTSYLPNVAELACPSAALVETTIYIPMNGSGPNMETLHLAAIADSVTADPSKRYSLGEIHFDHSNSVVGDPPPGKCGWVQTGMTFEIRYAYLLGTDGTPIECQHEDAHWYGSDAVPSLPSTWARIKAGYR